MYSCYAHFDQKDMVDKLISHFNQKYPDFTIFENISIDVTDDVTLYITKNRGYESNKIIKVKFPIWDIDNYDKLKFILEEINYKIEHYNDYTDEKQQETTINAQQNKPLQIKNCINCNAVLEKNTETCPYCGTCY